MSVDGLAAFLGGHPIIAVVVTVLAGFVVWSAGVEAGSTLVRKLRGLSDEDDRGEARDILGVLILVSTGMIARHEGEDGKFYCSSVDGAGKLHEETLWYLLMSGLIAGDQQVTLTSDGYRLVTIYDADGLEAVHRALRARRREQRAQSKDLTTATIEES